MSAEALVSILTTDSRVTRYVGVGLDARVFQDIAPQDAESPYIVFRRVGSDRDQFMGGRDLLVAGQYALLCWAEDHATAEAMRGSVVSALDCQADTFAGVVVRALFVTDDSTDAEPPFSAQELGEHGALLGIECWYEEVEVAPV